MTSRPDPGEIDFESSFAATPGELVRVSPRVRRIVAGNAGPMTFTGTCTYVVGTGRVAVIDPGPPAQDHIAALLDALRGETIVAILVTHTHKDHSPGARMLKAATGAKIYGCPSPTTSPDHRDIPLRLDAAVDLDHAPDVTMHEGDAIEGSDFALVCIETPGHTATHRAFALPQEHALFSGDHVMAWSTSVVAPPDGNMAAYMQSLDKLHRRDDRIYWPGHGGAVTDPHRHVGALARHRRNREAAILACLAEGPLTIEAIVGQVYRDLDPRLHAAAALSVLAHLDVLVARGLVVGDGATALATVFARA